jgi:hypothetical protein
MVPAITPLAADQALERYFLEARAKLLDLAAILDRIDRGQGGAHAQHDPRWKKIQQALTGLQEKELGRAEKLQLLFSLPYDAGWEKPQPK